MLLQPLLMVFSAIAVAGIARRLGGPVASLGAGVTWIAMPTVILATQSNWYGLGAAAALAGAMWALVTSDRCSNRRVWLYGLGVGCMLLSRTMTLGFLPAAVVGGLVVAGFDRRRLLRLAGALGVTAVVAGPWWITEWSTVTGYLVSYGYGPRAGLFGHGSTWDRLAFRLGRMGDAIGLSAWLTMCLVSVGVLIVHLWGRYRHGRPLPLGREALALAATAVACIAALVSTTNNGVWFELPLIAVVIPLAWGWIATAPWPAAAITGIPVVGMGIVQLAAAWWLIAPGSASVGWLAQNYITGAQYEGGFSQYDTRFATDRRDDLAAATADWKTLNQRVARSLRSIDGGRDATVFTMSGNMELLNSNTLLLAAEVDGWGARIQIPDTTQPDHERAASLAPRADDGRRRVLVLARHDHILFTPDRDVSSFARQARAAGWVLTERFHMPGGGRVDVLRRGGGVAAG
jgi:hypothetical protein